jgi:hypothetical protein
LSAAVTGAWLAISYQLSAFWTRRSHRDDHEETMTTKNSS